MGQTDRHKTDGDGDKLGMLYMAGGGDVLLDYVPPLL